MKIVIANLKMTLNKAEMQQYLELVNEKNFRGNEIVVCPSMLYLSLDEKYNRFLGSQNIYEEESGSYTGEISASQVNSLGINYTIINHSERNLYFNETLEKANKKIILAMQNNLIPIVCLGDSKAEKDNNKSIEAIKSQLDKLFENIDLSKRIIVAYEPLYAIGTNLTPMPSDINEICMYIKSYFEKSQNIDIIYGGSINETNIYNIMNECEINGVIIGKHITNINNLIEIIDNI